MDLLYCILYSSAGNTGADKCKRLQKAKTKQTLLKTTAQLFMHNLQIHCLKNSQNCFCHNLIKFPPTLIIFGKKMAKTIKLCVVHLGLYLPTHLIYVNTSGGFKPGPCRGAQPFPQFCSSPPVSWPPMIFLQR